MRRLLLGLMGLVFLMAAAACGSQSNASDGGGDGGGDGAACAFAATYTITDWSGRDTNDVMRLSPPNFFHYQGETPFSTDGGLSYPFCDPRMPACNDQAHIDVTDVEGAIAHPDVQAALAMTMASYGSFGFPSPTLREMDFSRSAGGRFNVAGADCPAGANPCTPIPPGIQALVDLLRALKQQQRADPACSGVN